MSAKSISFRRLDIKRKDIEAILFISNITYDDLIQHERDYRIAILETLRTIPNIYANFELWFTPIIPGHSMKDTPFLILAVSRLYDHDPVKPSDLIDAEQENPEARIVKLDNAWVITTNYGTKAESTSQFFTGKQGSQQTVILNLVKEIKNLHQAKIQYPYIGLVYLSWPGFKFVNDATTPDSVRRLIGNPKRVKLLFDGGAESELLKSPSRPSSPVVRSNKDQSKKPAPSPKPSSEPSKKSEPKAKPSSEPSKKPAPSPKPSSEPSKKSESKPKPPSEPSKKPALSPKPKPSSEPSKKPAPSPKPKPSSEPNKKAKSQDEGKVKVQQATITKDTTVRILKKKEEITGGKRIIIRIRLDDDSASRDMTWSDWFQLLDLDANAYIGKLVSVLELEAKYDHYFLEFHPVTNDQTEPFEFAIFDAGDQFEGLIPNPKPFEQYLAKAKGDTAVFPSLEDGQSFKSKGMLVVPKRRSKSRSNCYLDLASFMRCFDDDRDYIEDVFKVVFDEMRKLIAKGGPVWLSTHGLSVAWIHFRLFPEPVDYHDYYGKLASKYTKKVPSRRDRPTTPVGAGVVINLGEELGLNLGDLTLDSNIETSDPVLPVLGQPATPGIYIPKMTSLNFPKDIDLELGKRKSKSRAASSVSVSEYIDVAQISGSRGKPGVHYNDKQLKRLFVHLFPNVNFQSYKGDRNKIITKILTKNPDVLRKVRSSVLESS